MTREEAIHALEDIIEIYRNDEEKKDWVEACAYAINLTADTVSREQYDYVCEEYNRLVHKAVCIKLCDENCEYEKGKTCYHAREHSAIEALEQEPEPIRINLNELIKVKLTDWGKEIYYHQYDKTNQFAGREICKPKFPKEDENGYTKFQLWCFMELYGMHMGMASPNVIEPLEIVYER